MRWRRGGSGEDAGPQDRHPAESDDAPPADGGTVPLDDPPASLHEESQDEVLAADGPPDRQEGPVRSDEGRARRMPARLRARPRGPRPVDRGGLWWVLPAAVVLLVVTGWPIGRAVYDSLFSASLVTPDDRTFVGLDIYLSVLSSGTWWSAVGATAGLVVVAVLAQLVLATALASAVRRVTHGVRWLQVLLLVPFALLSVTTATLWRDGLVLGFGPAWFGYGDTSTTAAVVAVVLAEVWRGTGVTTLILLAGLSRVSPALLEASLADGANAWQRFWRVTRPAAAPAVAVAVVYRSLDALRGLDASLLAPDGVPGTVPLLVWDSTFEAFELGLGAAVSVLLLVLAGLLGLLLARLLRVRRVL